MYSDQVVGNNIRTVRVLRGYSQDYLAYKLKISQNAYSKLELGYVRIKLETMLTIAIVLQANIMTFIESPLSQLNDEQLPVFNGPKKHY